MGVGRINIHSFYDNYAIGGKQNNNNLQNTENVQIEQTGKLAHRRLAAITRLTRKLTKHLYILILKNLHLILRTETDSILLPQMLHGKTIDIKRKLYLDMEKDQVLDQYKFFIGTAQRCRRCLILVLMQMVQ